MTSCTTDSGTETLFSDDSPCELIGSPSIFSGDETLCQNEQNEDVISVNSRLAPPNIQPYSGVLEKVSQLLINANFELCSDLCKKFNYGREYLKKLGSITKTEYLFPLLIKYISYMHQMSVNK